MGEAEEKTVGDKVAGEVALKDGGLIAGAVITLVYLVVGVDLRGGVAEGQGDFSRFRGSFVLLMDVEKVFLAGGVEVFGDRRCWFAGALEEGVKRPIE